MSDREAFEKTFTVPNDAFYNADINGYCWRTHPFSEHPFDATYEGWCAGKQAAQAQAGNAVAEVFEVLCEGRIVYAEVYEGAVIPHRAKLYTAPPAAVNQQLLEALQHIMKMQTFGYIVLGEEATTKARAAIAAAQERK